MYILTLVNNYFCRHTSLAFFEFFLSLYSFIAMLSFCFCHLAVSIEAANLKVNRFLNKNVTLPSGNWIWWT